jgi:hypothetical protein
MRASSRGSAQSSTLKMEAVRSSFVAVIPDYTASYRKRVLFIIRRIFLFFILVLLGTVEIEQRAV